MEKKNGMQLYLAFSVVFIIVFLGLALFENGKIINWAIMFNDPDWNFTDFFRQIIYASNLNLIYFNTNDAPFPPFAYVFYHFLYLINPFVAPVELSSWTLARDKSFNMLIFLFLEIIKILLLFISVQCLLKKKYSSNTLILFFVSILFSIPFLFGAVERGNIILLVIGLLLFAFYFRDSDKMLYKEIALILIAVCTAIKVYPAIIGLIYIKEKRYKEAFRLLIYGILFFFVPFVFTGGFQGLMQYIRVLSEFGTRTISRWTSINSFIYATADALKPGIDKQSLLPLVLAVENVFLFINVLSFFKCKKKFVSYILLCSILSVYVSDSYRYTAVYMLIPFIYFLLKEEKERFDFVYLILFSLVFSIPVYAYLLHLSVVDFFIFVPIYLLCFVAYLDTWVFQRKAI